MPPPMSQLENPLFMHLFSSLVEAFFILTYMLMLDGPANFMKARYELIVEFATSFNDYLFGLATHCV